MQCRYLLPRSGFLCFNQSPFRTIHISTSFNTTHYISSPNNALLYGKSLKIAKNCIARFPKIHSCQLIKMVIFMGYVCFMGGVINSNILPKNDSSSRHLFPLPPRLDITLHFTLEVVHELMQQQQTSQWSSKTYLTISNNSKNLKHPPISYLCNSTFQNFNGTN